MNPSREPVAATVDRIPADVPAEDAEMWCGRCGQRHGVVWFAPSDLWNAVMREGDRGNPDEYGFFSERPGSQHLADALLDEARLAADLEDGTPGAVTPEAVQATAGAEES